jgi:undecaprenyl-diphosphatase
MPPALAQVIPHTGFAPMNDWLLSAINGLAGHDRVLDATMLACARYLIYLVFAVAAVWLARAAWQRQWHSSAAFVANLVLAFLLLLVAAHLIVEQRPFVTHQVTQLLPHAANQSFPSDHTTAASAIAFGFMLFTRWRKTGAMLLVAALVLGFARVYVGVHYPLDILGGVIIAAMASALTWLALRWYEASPVRRCRS